MISRPDPQPGRKVCIYHKSCADGMGAMMAVYKKWKSAVTYIPAQYGEPRPADDLLQDAEVYIVDFSYKRPVMLEIAKLAKQVTVLDHHKTAQEELVFMPSNVTVCFDMTRSGAMMAWEYFHPMKPVPDLVRHIQDRDLWKFELPYTKEIMATVFSYPYEIREWKYLLAERLDDLKQEGEAILRAHEVTIKKLTDQPEFIFVTIDGHRVPAVNAPGMLSSDIGNTLAPDYPFVCTYFDVPDGRVYSLRSSQSGPDVDVAEIAKKFGGGGHRNAAGFKLDTWAFPESFKAEAGKHIQVCYAS